MSMVVMAVVVIVLMIMIVVAVIIVMAVVIVIIVMAVVIVVVMILIIMIVVAVIIVAVIIMNMHFPVKELSFSPNKSRSNGCLNGKRAAVAKTPLENTTKHPIDGVMPGIPLKVGVKSTVTFDGDDGREVEFTGFKGLSTTMGAVGKSCGTCRKRKG